MPAEIDYTFDHPVRGDAVLGAGRLGRVAWLGKRLRDDDLYLLQDGAFSKLLFNEVLECFVGGQFIATIVLGFSLIERSIAGRLSHIGQTSVAKGGTSEQLIDAAFNLGWLTGTERDRINDVRKLRNAVVHFREHRAEDRPEVKAALISSA
ncbi:MAG: hypothetical protein IPH26_11435 [Sterolibacteriaceae bacterium]|uniref:Uncharacterized protein n=1 Tax=Candidatus Methylophosphatis roskildensis TaxID=2899263 RepID=A0A9D7E3J8_9PROT|nr:hypothetical protein [Candidatus Methylophosphatis roskildensis]